MRSRKKQLATVILLLLSLLLSPLLITSNKTESYPVERNYSIVNSLPGKDKDKPAEVLKKKPKPKKSSNPKPSTSPSPVKPPVETPTPKVTTPAVTPTPKPSTSPSNVPLPTVSPTTEPVDPNSGYIKPTITFSSPTCLVKDSSVVISRVVAFTNGNGYSYAEPWRDGRSWLVLDGRTISFTHFESYTKSTAFDNNFTFPNRKLIIHGLGKTDYIPLPPLDFSICR